MKIIQDTQLAANRNRIPATKVPNHKLTSYQPGNRVCVIVSDTNKKITDNAINARKW